MPRVKVTGYLELEDNEFDPGRAGPLTQAAFERIIERGELPVSMLDDVEFEVADDV